MNMANLLEAVEDGLKGLKPNARSRELAPGDRTGCPVRASDGGVGGML